MASYVYKSLIFHKVPRLNGVSVVFIINDQWIDWGNMFGTETVGYVSLVGSDEVLSCRLKAVIRRLSRVLAGALE